jgi:hypothetical protein
LQKTRAVKNVPGQKLKSSRKYGTLPSYFTTADIRCGTLSMNTFKLTNRLRTWQMGFTVTITVTIIISRFSPTV